MIIHLQHKGSQPPLIPVPTATLPIMAALLCASHSGWFMLRSTGENLDSYVRGGAPVIS